MAYNGSYVKLWSCRRLSPIPSSTVSNAGSAIPLSRWPDVGVRRVVGVAVDTLNAATDHSVPLVLRLSLRLKVKWVYARPMSAVTTTAQAGQVSIVASMADLVPERDRAVGRLERHAMG